MKLFKRNMVVLTVLMFVCVAVYLNWSYSRGDKNSDTVIYESEQTAQEMAAVMDDYSPAEDAGLFYTAGGAEEEKQVLQGIFLENRTPSDLAADIRVTPNYIYRLEKQGVRRIRGMLSRFMSDFKK